jgi:hypothetical protein
MAGPYLEAAARVSRQRQDPVEKRAEPVERTRWPIGSPHDAARLVPEVAALGVDFVKIRTTASRDTYLAIGEAARRAGKKLTGHAESRAVDDILRAGHVLIDHPILPPLDQHTAEQRRTSFERLARAGHAIVPTLSPWFTTALASEERVTAVVNDEKRDTDPRRRYLSRFRRTTFAVEDLGSSAGRFPWDDLGHGLKSDWSSSPFCSPSRHGSVTRLGRRRARRSGDRFASIVTMPDSS